MRSSWICPLRFLMRTEPSFLTALSRTPPLVAAALVLNRLMTSPEPSRFNSHFLVLLLCVREYFGNLAIVTATVSRNKTVLARGEIKIQHDAARTGQDTSRPTGDC